MKKFLKSSNRNNVKEKRPIDDVWKKSDVKWKLANRQAAMQHFVIR